MTKTKKINYTKLANSSKKKASKSERIVKFVAFSMVVMMVASMLISVAISFINF